MGTLTRGLFITAAVTVLAAAPARADDAAVWNAWGSHTPELKAANDDYTRAYDAAFDRGSPTRKELKALIAANKRIDSIMAAIRAQVDAAQPSTDAVANAKTLTLREIVIGHETNRVEVAAERQWLKGHKQKGHDLWVRSSHLNAKYVRLRQREKKAWVAAGYHPVGT
jgi:hypothetical protein